MNEDTILRFLASGRKITLVSGEIKFIRIFAGDHPSEGIKVKYPSINNKYMTSNLLYFENGAR